MTYWKDKERAIVKWWSDRLYNSRRLYFNTGGNDRDHADVIVKIPDSELKIDGKSTHAKDTITIKKKDCKKLNCQNKSIQFCFFNDSENYTIIPTEEYERLISISKRRGGIINV